MLTIIYDPIEGVATADAVCKGLVYNLINISKSSDISYETGTALVIDNLRLAIKNKDISPNEVILKFKGETIDILENGRLKYWPDGFCDYYSEVLAGLIR